MPQNKELEIQLQFLAEAHEYLSTIEAAVLGIASSGIDIHKINAALRAAHSIKGGAGMMGFHTLSEFAHRLEDSLKVLKIQKHSIHVDAEIEHLLLTSLDCLSHVIDCNHHACFDGSADDHLINAQWLETEALPILEQLHDRLGDPEEETAQSVLSPEDGHDIIPLLFQTEVEGCLQRLEAVIDSGDPCLPEELDILAQELGGLGEMLQIEAFTQLCASVSQALTIAPERATELAAVALDVWRRSQALVLTGHLDALPTALVVPGLAIEVPVAVEATLVDDAESLLNEATFQLIEDVLPDTLPELSAFDLDQEITITSIIDTTLNEGVEQTDELDQDIIHDAVFENIFDDSLSVSLEQQSISPEPFNASVRDSGLNSSNPTPALSQATPSSNRRVLEMKPDADATLGSGPSDQEVFVRVPLKQLNQVNDLLGELTIERNGLELYLKRLRDLVTSLSQRVRVLDQSNQQLRTAYDRITVQSTTGSIFPASEPQDSSRTDIHQAFLIPFDDSLAAQHGFDRLELDQYTDLHLLSQEVMETTVQLQEVTTDIDFGLDDVEQTSRNLNKTTRQLQTRLTQLRMRPLSDIVDRFPRAVREWSLQHGKPVELRLEGVSLLVDRNILESLNEPLMHLLRNAFDHGIEDPQTRQLHGKPEQGRIEIQAVRHNNQTLITVRDDGGGIPLDKIRSRARQMGLDDGLLETASDEELLSLIFEPGFSTREQVTALSGRGVGMDVVRERLRQVRGEIRVDTEVGVGTTFTLSVPYTLAVTKVLIAESNGMLLAFPADAIEEMLVIPPERRIQTIGGDAFEWEGQVIQLIRLQNWLKFNCPRRSQRLELTPAISEPTVLITHYNSQLMALEVDRFWGEQEVAIRQVEGSLKMPLGFSNCTILGDGRVVPLVSLAGLLEWIINSEAVKHSVETSTSIQWIESFSSPQIAITPQITLPALPASRKATILIVDDSINVRRFLALTLEKAGYQIEQAKDGQDALEKLMSGLEVQAVICDIEMPRLDGYGFLARVKSNPTFEQLPVAMLTSRSGEKHRQLAMNLGATAYFSKPYNEQVLLQTLAQITDLTPTT